MKKWVLEFASYESKDDIFKAVKTCRKTIETRPRNPKSSRDYSNIKVGDILVCKSLNSGKVVEKKVTFVHSYDSVNKMVEREDEEKILPGIGSKENLLKFYEEAKKKWGRNYTEKLEKYGIVAIGMK